MRLTSKERRRAKKRLLDCGIKKIIIKKISEEELKQISNYIDRRIDFCYHEAGHAIAADYFGFKINKITSNFSIIPTEQSWKFGNPNTDYEYDDELSNQKEDRIKTMYAGAWAEATYLSQLNNSNFDDELEHVKEIGSAKGDFEKINKLDSNWLQNPENIKATKAILENLWNKIKYMAEELKKKNILNAQEFKELIQNLNI